MEIAQVRRARERATALKTEKPSKAALFAEIEKAPPQQRKILKQVAEEHDRSHQSDKEKLRKEIQLYRTLSTAGITAATFAHESAGNPIKAITFSIAAIERRARAALRDDYAKQLDKPVQAIVGAIHGLAVLSTVTNNLLDHEKRRRGEVKLHKVIGDIIDTFKPFTDGRDVIVTRKFGPGAPFLHGSPAAIESIITNLINNSVAALEGSTAKSRLIHVHTEVLEKTFTLKVSDNGPGINGIRKNDIWLPGETTRKNGTGLGLAIVKDTVIDLGGEVDTVEHGELGGAEIIIKLPLLGH
jgi:C4-dicarboxylate-specific signal transduction histidine kinase